MASIAKFDSWLNSAGVARQTVLQLKSATKTDTFTGNPNATWLAIPGLSLSITPISTSSKILLLASINYDSNRGNSGGGFAFWKNGSIIQEARGVPVGSRYAVFGDFGANANADQSGMNRSLIYLDSPATTSAITYDVRFYQDTNSFTTFINRSRADLDNGDDPRMASTITVMEIAG